MLKIQEIRELIKLVDQSSIDEFTFEHDGSKIKMKKHNDNTGSVMKHVNQEVQQAPAAVQETVQQAPTAVAAPVAVQAEAPKSVEAASTENLHKITSPMVGTFYAAPSPDTENYVKVGDRVNTNKVVCIVEAMKLFNEIEAEVNGEIVEILVKNGQLVEYGQPLFLVKPE
ncbi:acetyl-CoA carboxylase biotin carboxyl carrier protein [Bacillus luteolus]|uniref:Biotin carboxyl carrier protein of acetyl-CoA carboxylase n=1 Tax=Litchfieldia luteola TaxID=682179 RepID=A0ABR9QPL6_9BACI|nr:acetyl-CoA carboxylase biotin carboxyl carrier protein [Cytobacillus luteolus]MBE4910451.1 acetyl-CoA carboxylase biotin carboxyl carrier protein [Cytobacillus luteolus]MBP1941973.1 acetyl-CoA carboxylase biotin carboxyl carrier protein [Cytobacillus luteolus]